MSDYTPEPSVYDNESFSDATDAAIVLTDMGYDCDVVPINSEETA
jgi:hypothetical protein